MSLEEWETSTLILGELRHQCRSNCTLGLARLADSLQIVVLMVYRSLDSFNSFVSHPAGSRYSVRSDRSLNRLTIFPATFLCNPTVAVRLG